MINEVNLYHKTYQLNYFLKNQLQQLQLGTLKRTLVVLITQSNALSFYNTIIGKVKKAWSTTRPAEHAPRQSLALKVAGIQQKPAILLSIQPKLLLTTVFFQNLMLLGILYSFSRLSAMIDKHYTVNEARNAIHKIYFYFQTNDKRVSAVIVLDTTLLRNPVSNFT